MKKNPSISIITVVLNNKNHIASAIESVLSQKYENIEYIIIDGGSTDGTMEIVEKYKNRISKIVSEKDEGIYYAMNKGLNMASGDIIGILNSDDIYTNSGVADQIVKEITEVDADVCWGNMVYVNKNDTDKIVRFWKSSEYKKGKFQKGWAPPHSTFFVKKEIYAKYGRFKTDFSIAADYELMLRFLEKHRIKSCYIPKVLVKMRMGGRSNSSLSNIARGAIECYRSWKINNLKINPIIPLFIRPASKIFQYFQSINDESF